MKKILFIISLMFLSIIIVDFGFAACGDGVVDGSETCDPGDGNWSNCVEPGNIGECQDPFGGSDGGSSGGGSSSFGGSSGGGDGGNGGGGGGFFGGGDGGGGGGGGGGTNNDDYLLIPEGDASKAGEIGKEPGKLWKEYNEKAKEMEASPGDQIASGIMTWNTVLSLLKHIVNFISNIALVIGALTIIYAGYLYATQVFGGQASKGKDAIMKSIQGILVVVFAFAILKILVNMFLGGG